MKLGGRVLLAVLALDLLALVMGGGVAGVVGGIALVGVLAPAPRLTVAATLPLHLVALLGLVALAAAGRTQDGLAVLVGWLLVHRAWTGQTRGDARLALLLGGLLLLLGCLRTESVAMAAVLLGTAALLPAALMRVEVGASLRYGVRSAGTGAAVVVLAAGIFLLLPRLNAGYLGSGGRPAEAGEVLLGDDQTDIRSDQQVVMHLRVTDAATGAPVAGPFYVRGRGLDRFDGARWTATLAPDPHHRPPEPDARADVELEPAAGGVVYAPFEATAITGIDRPIRDGDATFFHHEGATATRYVAAFRRGPGEPAQLTADARAALLQLPDVDPRVVDLARTIAPAEQDPTRIASALQGYLSENLAYLPDPPPPAGDPLATFLFDRKAGHCEYFASALAVMLRVRGVPARLGTGYWTGELDDDGRMVVRAADAHAWVEVPTDAGWRIYDASPVDGLPSHTAAGLLATLEGLQQQWTRWIVEYNLGDQSNALARIGRGAAALAGRPEPSWAAGSGLLVTVAALGAGYALAVVAQLASGRLVVRPRGAAADPLARAARRARERLRALGIDAPHMPLGMLAAQAPPTVADPLQRLADAVYAGRYGGEDPARALRDAREADRALAAAVRATLRARR